MSPFPLAERRALVEELGVIAGGVEAEAPHDQAADGSEGPETLEVFFVDPSSKSEQYGGPDGWARCVKGYLNARGYGASIGVAASREAALAAARSRWGIVVIHENANRDTASRDAAGRVSDHDPRVQTGVGLRAPRGFDGSASGSSGHGHASPARPAPQPGQLGLPGLVLGRPKRQRARAATARKAS